MNGLKRSHSSGKNGLNRYNGKVKDVCKSSTVNYKNYETHTPETDSGTLNFPVIKISDNAQLLPRYSTVLSRSFEDAVCMEDLDQLQHDFEKLLSNCAVRHRLLRSEIESIDKVEERREKKKKPSDKTSQKRKRSDDKQKHKDVKNGARILKKHYALPINNFISDVPIKHEVPKVSLPKNDTSDKFWLSIEPYCADVGKDDVAFLDELIQECSQETEVKIPEVGEHYATEWSEEMLAQEQNMGNIGRPAKSKQIILNTDIKKNGLNTMVDTFSSPLTQRLLAGLIEEKVMTKFPTVTEKLKASDLSLLITPNGPNAGVCMDRRLRKELVEQGILDVEDLPKSIPPEDDILIEIKKCQQELATVNEHNVEELNKLRTIIAKDLRRQEVKEALDKVDNQVMEMYNKILVAKQKQSLEDDTEQLCDKLTLSKQVLVEFESEANSIIKQQIILHREITELTDFTML